MPFRAHILWLVFLGLLTASPGLAQESEGECPYPKGREIEDLSAALAAHAQWLEQNGWENPGIPGRANFCNANLTKAMLQGANLAQANLQGAILVGASLQGASLLAANLEGAILFRANLQGASLPVANLQDADLSKVMLQKADLTQANLQGANLREASLQGANLEEANLQGATLELADLQGSDLSWANLQGTNLHRADLQGANLHSANLQGASLVEADLQGAALVEATLQEAHLISANLQGANLLLANLQEADLTLTNLQEAQLFFANLQAADIQQSMLSNAVLYGADLSRARYQPATAPAYGTLSGLTGLGSVWFCPGDASGLVQLREAFKEAGLRDLERVVTSTLERTKTGYALARWNGRKFDDEKCPDLERNRWAAIEGVFRLVFFEWTTDYSLAYGRPLLILLALIGVFTVVYLPALLIPSAIPDGSGIYRIWPEGRITREGKEPIAAGNVVVERLNPNLLSALGLAFYFSLVSAFHLGWRDLNVGTWIARLQPREYALRAKGWVRVVSGTQSLISVYLVAMWVLTYFGRPFG